MNGGFGGSGTGGTTGTESAIQSEAAANESDPFGGGGESYLSSFDD
jgi:hypothetical protein